METPIRWFGREARNGAIRDDDTVWAVGWGVWSAPFYSHAVKEHFTPSFGQNIMTRDGILSN